MMSSEMRSIMAMAVITPSRVTWKIQSCAMTVPGGVEEVQHRGEGDDEQHRLEAAEERPRAHLRDAHGDDQRQDQHAVGNGALARKMAMI